MLVKRLIVAIIILPFLYLYIMRLPSVYFFGLILLVSVLALHEFYSMYGVKDFMRPVGLLLGIVTNTSFFIFRDYFPIILIMLIILSFVIRLFGKGGPESALRDLGTMIVPLLYIPCLLNFQLLLREDGPEWIIFLYGTVWAADSLAFYIGKTLGKRKLYEAVSPKKTVAGAAGSLMGGLTSAYLFSLFLIDMEISKVIITGLVTGVSAVIGDLIESMFKRDAGVKDSSNLIPGHGGILDKIDGSLFTGPVLWLIMRI